MAALVAGPKARRARGEEGFTLLELLITLVLIPLVIGGVAFALITGLKATDSHDPAGTASRLAQSHDVQITSAYFVRDVQSAQYVSTQTSPALCGSASQLVGLRWIKSETSPPVTVNVSYTVSTSAPYVLVRRYCEGTSAESDSTISHDLFNPPSFGGLAPVPTVAVSPVVKNSGCASGNSCVVGNSVNAAWVTVNCLDGTTGCGSNAATVPVLPPPSPGVKSVQLTVREAGSGFTYTLTGVPRVQLLQSNGGPTPCTTTSNPPCVPTPPLLLLGNGAGVVGCVGGNGTVTVNGLVGVNSSTDGSISMQNSTLTSTGIYSTDVSNPNGAYTGNNPYTGSVQSGAMVPDPYEDTLPYDGPAANDPNGIGPQGTQLLEPIPASAPSTPNPNGTTYNPGYYSGGLTLTGNQTFTFASGVYVFNGNLKISGGASLQSATGGVLIYVYNGIVDLSGGGNVSLTALPSANGYQNVVIWESELNGSSGSVTLGGNGNVTSISGSVYSPTGTVSTAGNGSVAVMSITANKLACNGNGATSIAGNGIITTPQPSTVVVNNSVQDLATVFGSINGPAPTGTVKFYSCSPSVLTANSASTCSSSFGTQIPGTNPVTLTANGTGSATATSPSITPNATGTWCFAGYYSGDSTYAASNDSSAGECFSVTSAGPTGVSIVATPNPKNGKPDSGDAVQFTYSAAMSPGSIMTGWNGTSAAAVTVNFAHCSGSSGPDCMTVSGVNLGSVNLGGQYVKTGTGKSYTASGSMTMSGGGTVITITLTGTGASNVNQDTGSYKMVWTPSASATDTSNNACQTTQATEASAAENF